ncbi:glycosyltransferase family 2 protein [Flavobacteriaceae bacterium GSB9]|nr:glycosyltransferase family 2 protein [Flavobacteriaceae bacterium GSB9]
MSAHPFFSVVIPLYNKEKYIVATLKSVINQTFQNFEVIVVNDGSTDDSLKLVNSFNDKRITILQQKNTGLSSARNVGIKQAKARYIAFLDADDLWAYDFLETMQLLICKNKNYGVFSCPTKIFFNDKSLNLKPSPYKEEAVNLISNYFKFKKNLFGFSSVVIKKQIFDEIGYFKTNINFGEEEDFNIRCFKKKDLVFYGIPKAYYRKGTSGQLTSPNKSSNRIIPDYGLYLKNNKNKDLAKYIDFVHYKLVVLYKMEKNHKLVDFYKNKIDTSNLSFLQKFKYYLPTNLFYILKSTYISLSKKFIHF